MKNLNWDKELKKVQRCGLYNPKVRVFCIIAVAVLTLGMGLTFSAFSYSSGDNQAFNSKVNKKVKVKISVSNGSGAVNTTTNYKSSGTVEYSVVPNSGYALDEDNTTCNYNPGTKKVIITPSTDTTCIVAFKETLKHKIIANNPLKTQVPDFSKGEPPTSGTNTGSGLYSAADDDGDSYYFRGAIENNYVSFANILWRIVRLNGDGSIRVITQDKIGTSYFNSANSHKYVGYMFNNTAANTQDGTDSIVKKYLEEWYQSNISSSLDGLVVSTTFCNDTSTNDFEANTTSYGITKRLGTDVGLDGTKELTKEQVNPSFKCSISVKNYGGKYNLKIGLLSADEASMAGLIYKNQYSSNTKIIGATTDNYLSTDYDWYTMTPYNSQDSYASIVSIFNKVEMYRTWPHPTSESGVRAVINLKADILFSSGDGTKDNPYVILTD